MWIEQLNDDEIQELLNEVNKPMTEVNVFGENFIVSGHYSIENLSDFEVTHKWIHLENRSAALIGFMTRRFGTPYISSLLTHLTGISSKFWDARLNG